MDYSSANVSLWKLIIQLGVIAAAVLVSNGLRRKLAFVRKSLMPTAVIAGFLLLLLRTTGVLQLDTAMLEMLTYHGLAIGFIAMSLRIPRGNEKAKDLVAPKSGMIIVCCYLIQGIAGLLITLFLAYTFMPGLFKAAGVLLPMGYGQGPGQANNIGSTYEALGFAGGRSFGLAIAASGYLCACIVGVAYLNVLARRGKVRGSAQSFADAVTVDTFQDMGEVPISESIDRLSLQMAMVCMVYLLTYFVTMGLCALVERALPGMADMLSTLLWGFNFIVGSALAILLRQFIKALTKGRVITRQYQNNYLLSRISGLCFDVMIVAGIASIDIGDLTGLWVPFALLSLAGGVITLLLLQRLCKKVYPDYYYEGLMSMYGMMTGTISSGVLLLREIDPQLDTPAANNLILGSSFAILFALPVLLLVSLAPKAPWITLLLMAVYFTLLMLCIYRWKPRKR
ncbi:MAG: hypothetical protein Q4E65_05490 [Clostridia bacterium]|nr:hypothetical protein [Clostridia bacterium]